jgi:hypothetical protein
MLRATTAVPARPAPSGADWLGQCGGFRVDGVDGRIGTVRSIGLDRSGSPAWLEVRSGLFARRTVTVRIDEVVSVDPIAHRIVTAITRSGLDGGE